jgi:tetratricopeptide (TPR) repeat protein
MNSLPAGWPSALMTYSYQLMYIRDAKGRLGEMVEVAEMTATANPGIPGFQRFHASALVEANRLDDARVAFEPLVASGFRLLPFDTAWLSSIDGCAYVAAALEDHASAALIADMLDPWREQLIYDRVLCRGSVALPLGVALAAAGRFREADEAFSHAAAVHERIPAPIELARTRVEWATMLVRRAQEDDEAHARVLAESALATAMELGLQSIARKAVAITRPR